MFRPSPAGAEDGDGDTTRARTRPSAGRGRALRARRGAGGSRVGVAPNVTATECDLVVKGVLAGEARGWYELSDGTFQSDRVEEPPVSDAALRAVARTPGQELTYTCVPPGSGERMGVDRDRDGYFDRDEIDAGSDPADPTSIPGVPPTLIPTTKLILRDLAPARRKVTFVAHSRHEATGHRVVPPARGSAGDPIETGGSLMVYDSSGLTDNFVTVALPATGWKARGTSRRPRYRFAAPAGTSPVSSLLVSHDEIVVRGGGARWLYTLDQPAQGRVAVRLRFGDGATWCADAPASSSPHADEMGRFRAALAPPPSACPLVP